MTWVAIACRSHSERVLGTYLHFPVHSFVYDGVSETCKLCIPKEASVCECLPCRVLNAVLLASENRNWYTRHSKRDISCSIESPTTSPHHDCDMSPTLRLAHPLSTTSHLLFWKFRRHPTPADMNHRSDDPALLVVTVVCHCSVASMRHRKPVPVPVSLSCLLKSV